MRRRARRRADAGFTMLELLLSLALLALLTGALMEGLQLGRKAFETSRINQAAGDLEATAAALSDLLAHAYPLLLPDTRNGQALLFDGRPDGCLFVGLSEGDTQQGGLFMGEIGLEPNGEHSDLAVWTAFFRTAESSRVTRESMARTEAARGVSFLQLRYFGQVEEGKAPRWNDNWAGLPRLPELVAVRFQASRFGRPIQMSFTVALRQKAAQ